MLCQLNYEAWISLSISVVSYASLLIADPTELWNNTPLISLLVCCARLINAPSTELWSNIPLISLVVCYACFVDCHSTQLWSKAPVISLVVCYASLINALSSELRRKTLATSLSSALRPTSNIGALQTELAFISVSLYFIPATMSQFG